LLFTKIPTCQLYGGTSMRPRSAAIFCAALALALALALAGCGGSKSSQSVAPVSFQSAALSGHKIPARYTCDGKNIHPTLEWGSVPSATGQLVLLVVGLTPSQGDHYAVSIEWAVAGISPELHKLSAGQLPPGAYVGLASDGERKYSICPKKGVTETYQFNLYAVRSSLEIAPSFSGISILAAFSTPHTQDSPIGLGAFVARYRRA
jgi:phosphatidylethanolamine-binding protein (PEBP) family uncharacterized protein